MYKRQQVFSAMYDSLVVITGLIVSMNIGYKLSLLGHQWRPKHDAINSYFNFMKELPPLILATFLIFEDKSGIKEHVQRLLFRQCYHTDAQVSTFLDKRLDISKHGNIGISVKHLLGLLAVVGGGGIGLYLGNIWWKLREEFIKEQAGEEGWELTEFVKVGQEDYDKFDRLSRTGN